MKILLKLIFFLLFAQTGSPAHVVYGMEQQISMDTADVLMAENEQKNDGVRADLRVRNRLIIVLIAIVCLLWALVLMQMCRYRKNRRKNDELAACNCLYTAQIEQLVRQIEECETDSEQLVLDNMQLETANTVKDRLLSVISHDLRSPVSSLEALLSLFNTNDIARSDLMEYSGQLLSRVENTSTMLENLLHWSQHQLNGFAPIFTRVYLQGAIDECINLYRMHAEHKCIAFDNSLKTDVSVTADVEMLKVILRNLISNALKFTHPGGTITIMSVQQDDFVVVSVKDTGVGMSMEVQERIFAAGNFTTPGTENEKGTGLGLMLCKDFVQHNGGTIWIDSRERAGTTFYFTIPIDRDATVG